MFTNGQNIGLWLGIRVKTICEVKTHQLSTEEGDANSLLEHGYPYWFPWKRYNCKQWLLLLLPSAKFTLSDPCIYSTKQLKAKHLGIGKIVQCIYKN